MESMTWGILKRGPVSGATAKRLRSRGPRRWRGRRRAGAGPGRAQAVRDRFAVDDSALHRGRRRASRRDPQPVLSPRRTRPPAPPADFSAAGGPGAGADDGGADPCPRAGGLAEEYPGHERDQRHLHVGGDDHETGRRGAERAGPAPLGADGARPERSQQPGVGGRGRNPARRRAERRGRDRQRVEMECHGVGFSVKAGFLVPTGAAAKAAASGATAGAETATVPGRGTASVPAKPATVAAQRRTPTAA